MKFKPVTERYKFTNETLVENYPEYLFVPILRWLHKVLTGAKILYWNEDIMHNQEVLRAEFLTSLNIHFRESFPNQPKSFFEFIFKENIRTTEILALCLQNYANASLAFELEEILSLGGSAFTVFFEREPTNAFDTGFSTLTKRVPQIVLDASREALDQEALLSEAWLSCYSRHPDYEKTVSRCCDVAESLLGKHYYADDTKPQIKKFVFALRQTPKKLMYKGVSLHDHPEHLTDLAEKFGDIRGQHTAGTGRSPTKEEAEFVLHYTIFLWNIHR